MFVFAFEMIYVTESPKGHTTGRRMCRFCTVIPKEQYGKYCVTLILIMQKQGYCIQFISKCHVTCAGPCNVHGSHSPY